MNDSYIYYPETILEPGQLDVFLSRGWYRMGQGIFTTHYLVQQEAIYRVYWLRYNLEKLQLQKSAQKILRINERFHVQIKPLRITGELETLFQLYKDGLSFDPAASVHQWLYGDQHQNVFDTGVIEVRDGTCLVAAGIFDNGQESISGIMNFYNHGYKRYSPGKFLMLQKILYARKQGKRWYYPGYIVYGYPKFDYKLFADEKAAEVYVAEANEWHRYSRGFMEMLANRNTDTLQ